MDILNDIDTDRMMILTTENIINKMMYQENLIRNYFNSNQEYVKHISNTINEREKLKVGALKEFISF